MREYSFCLMDGLKILDSVTVDAESRSEGSRKAKDIFRKIHHLNKPQLDRMVLFSYEGEIPYYPPGGD